MRLRVTSSLGLTKIPVDHELGSNNDFIPRIGDTIIIDHLYYKIIEVVIDYKYNEIRLWVIDSVTF